ncbi:MAG: lasso peptide biosynthesis B2 protein [Candidatus Rokuibacteriota bacterium]|nr:MAG: lasso peptide biosynthesis B2 protein [Candidatus Rokubacteria bacterium]
MLPAVCFARDGPTRASASPPPGGSSSSAPARRARRDTPDQAAGSDRPCRSTRLAAWRAVSRRTMTRLRRLARLPAADRRLLLRAAVLLWGTRVGLWVVSMRTVHRVLGRLMPVRAGWRRSVPFSPERIAWAARVGSRYVPRATCLVQALAVQRLLEREGHPACLRIGVAKSGRARLLAHAWVESAGRVVVGGGALEGYAPLLAWERERPRARGRRDRRHARNPRRTRISLLGSRRA